MSGLTYKDAGVDVHLKEELLRRIRDHVASTKRPEVIGDIGAFGGMFRFGGMKDAVLVASADGVGTKVKLAELLDSHETVGADLVNHCVNDIAVMGAEPLFFLDYFSAGKLEPARFERVVAGLAGACREAGIALLGGETAEAPGLYQGTDYDLAGFIVGAVERDRILDPASAREGDACVGLPSSGLHTNGYSLARAIVTRTAEAEGVDPLDVLRLPRHELRGGTLGQALLEVHRSYLAEIRALRDAAKIRSIAHITGGGWEGNLPRALPEGLGAVVDRETWIVPPVFRILADMGDVPEDDQWRTWNMGIGLVAIVAAEDERAALRALPDATLVGRVERASGLQRVRWA
jgi:phosphoribosylformylglycinamidine cyclo-ligase